MTTLREAPYGAKVRLIRTGVVVTPQCRSGHWVTCLFEDGRLTHFNGQCACEVLTVDAQGVTVTPHQQGVTP